MVVKGSVVTVTKRPFPAAFTCIPPSCGGRFCVPGEKALLSPDRSATDRWKGYFLPERKCPFPSPLFFLAMRSNCYGGANVRFRG